MNLTDAFARLEKRLQKLVEDRLDGIFTATDLQKTLGHELLVALQREARPTQDGRLLAPDQFTIFLPPETTQHLAAFHTRVDELARALEEALEDFARQSDYTFADKIVIRILLDQPAPSTHRPAPETPQPILATFKLQDTTHTATLGIINLPSPGTPAEQNAMPNSQDTPPEARAFLIVNGVDIFPLPNRLSGGVINIGRQKLGPTAPSNQIVLEDGRVSRTHAQLRIMQGRYMLFDLASSHGTFVNGLRINSHELKAGDVISFGGVPVVFGLEENTNHTPSQPLLPQED